MKVLAGFAIAVSLTASVHAQPVTIYGLGGHSCGEYIAATTGVGPGETRTGTVGGRTYHSLNALFNQWTLGFISAANLQTNANISIDLAGADLWLRNWCNNNPTESFAGALNALVQFQRR